MSSRLNWIKAYQPLKRSDLALVPWQQVCVFDLIVRGGIFHMFLCVCDDFKAIFVLFLHHLPPEFESE